MYPPPIARNPDLARLAGEGYALEVDQEGVLVVRHVPYVTPAREVKRGSLMLKLVLAGSIDDIKGFPDHTACFAGEVPCDHEGRPLAAIINQSERVAMSSRLTRDHYFSSKPGPNGYPSMYAQVKQYITILESHARRIDPDVTARVGPQPTPEGVGTEESPFVYADTASVRADIVEVTAKLRGKRIAIVGLGGTGSYVLDQVAKTPVAAIDLFDDDDYLTHNAFRAPGAATLEELRALPKKVHHWRDHYSAMHRGVTAHPYRVTAANVEELAPFDFVFLCMDSGPDKLAIITALMARGAPFVDCGIAVQDVGGALRGIVRVTASTSAKHDHVLHRVSCAVPRAGNDYERNIQVAELNMLNAAMAVIKWKKLMGFYHDFSNEYDSSYTLNSHLLTRDERHAPADDVQDDEPGGAAA